MITRDEVTEAFNMSKDEAIDEFTKCLNSLFRGSDMSLYMKQLLLDD